MRLCRPESTMAVYQNIDYIRQYGQPKEITKHVYKKSKMFHNLCHKKILKPRHRHNGYNYNIPRCNLHYSFAVTVYVYVESTEHLENPGRGFAHQSSTRTSAWTPLTVRTSCALHS